MWNRKVVVRIIEVLLCIACVTTLRITDDESRRVTHYLRNRSREWILLTNITWGVIGAALATATCGGYLIITVGLLIAAATQELRGRATESFFLTLGVILFVIIGGLAIFSIDSIPSELFDNAIVFGVLCIVTALVFIVDLLMSPGKSSHDKKHDGIQTFIDKEAAKQVVKKTTTTTSTTVNEREPSNRNTNRDWRVDSPEMLEKGSSMNASIEDVVRFQQAERQMSAPGNKSTMTRDEDFLDSRRSPKKIRSSDYYYHHQRTLDEVDDTPPFPTMTINQPGVKIMRVERKDTVDSYRYSDSSQYDNVPTRMRGSSPSGTSRRPREESSGGQHRSRGYRIDMLEESLNALRKSTTSTQTNNYPLKPKKPSSATDPGFVRHTASNWPAITASSNQRII